ncbi:MULTISPECIES: GNAT family N-acetyltransferase [Thalassospira]|uniref:GNAT family acetyltransferase n=1 Tax=Thalassospira profundimaris TaxID=502049 RepID=A0A367WZE9_9PROT|nr:GNAT family N-acetyltransferase [Thalassospira profundimaris]RCK46130.1 GNAT family acetyltransferase [Thalassospira profundimaris]
MQFETNRLILRPRTMDDFDACLAMDRARGVVDFIAGPWDDPDQHRAFIRDRINQDYGVGLGYWSIFAKSDPARFMGWILLIPEDAVGPDIEIGWRLHPDYWGRGIAYEAARTVMDHGLGHLELSRIVAAIDPDNTASRKLAARLGMVETGLRDEYVLHEITLERYRQMQSEKPAGSAR